METKQKSWVELLGRFENGASGQVVGTDIAKVVDAWRGQYVTLWHFETVEAAQAALKQWQLESRRVLGTVTVQAADVRTYRGYECAAWSKTLLLTPGVYSLRLCDGVKVDESGCLRHPQRSYHEASVDVPATIVADNFQSLWGGCPIGQRYDVTQNAGKPDVWNESVDLYSLAGWLLKCNESGKVPYLTLADDLEARYIRFKYYRPVDGQEYGVTTGIFEKSSPVDVVGEHGHSSHRERPVECVRV